LIVSACSGARLHAKPDQQYGRKFMRKLAAAILISASLLLAGCNTVKGLGRDIESVGDAGDKAT
jgi:predicted small secreted protein